MGAEIINMRRPIRVLCVFSTLNRGGAETMCMNLYRSIDRNKVQFDFVKHTDDTCDFDEEIIKLGGNIYNAPRLKGNNIIRYCNWWHKHLISHPEHQIIHGHFFTISPIYFGIAKIHKRITIGHAHSSKSYNKDVKTKVKSFLRLFIELTSDYCFACSIEAGKWLFPHRRFKVLKNALDTDLYKYNPYIRKKVRANLQISQEKIVIGTVGSMSDVKNPLGTVELFNLVHRHNKNSLLLWAGDGPLRKEVQEQIHDYGLDDSVQLLGVRSDVNELLQAMDIFVLPSRYEGLPVVLVEAQAAGLTCYISDTVTREVAITDNCVFMPIDGFSLWVEAILNRNIKREDTSEYIKKAGYDIKESAKWLQHFYMKVMSN